MLNAILTALFVLCPEPPPAPVTVPLDELHPGKTWLRNRGHKQRR